MALLSRMYLRLGDPRWAEPPAQALALLEPLPPGPELVGALTAMAGTEALDGRNEAAVSHAERALALAEKLRLQRPARALGSRGMARCELGDPAGLRDMREAITLAVEAGQGREAAVAYNNLGMELWGFEGPGAALEIMRAGIAFAQARGLAEQVNSITVSTLDALIDTGELDVALEIAAGLAEGRYAREAAFDFSVVRAAQARILAVRGQAADSVDSLDWIETTSRSGTPETMAAGLGSCALARAGIGQDDRAAELITEIDANPEARRSVYYAAVLPALVRARLGIGDRKLAERLAGGDQPRSPYASHALIAATAALAEARGDRQAAAEGYAETAERWELFGVVPERAFALLGRGRCLAGLGRPTEATDVLRQAQEIFARLGAAPALAQTEALLQQASALSS